MSGKLQQKMQRVCEHLFISFTLLLLVWKAIALSPQYHFLQLLASSDKVSRGITGAGSGRSKFEQHHGNLAAELDGP